MNFMIVKSLSPYNGIIGRPGLKAIRAVPSTVHEMLKFPVEEGIVTICSTILIPTECASVITSSVIPKEERTYIFAWQPSDMTGVPRSIAEHRLNIREGYSPVRQKKRGQAPERAKAIQAKVQKLVEAGIMREVYYHVWLSNPVMVKKHDGSWRMFVDFTDLNKACPQDCYPLPEIDWKVESLCSYPFKCFLDAYKGYHQIQLAEADKENTAFHTGHGVYYYTKMPFGLKNAGATYQRLMDKAFEGHIGQNIEVYVDDLVVKSHTEAEMMRDIEETFRTLRKCGLDDQTGNGPDANLLYKPRFIGSGIELLTDGETGPVTSLRGKKTPMVFSGTPYHGHYLSAHQASHVASRREVSQAVSAAETQEEPWTLFTDGSSCVDGSGAGLILTSPEGAEFTYALRFQFSASNNKAEYEALVVGLRIAAQMGVKNVQVSVDSKLVANQVLGTYMAKEDNMIKYLEIVKGLVSGFTTFSISQVPRSKNKKADALSKIASTSFMHLSKQVLVEVLENKSIKEKEVVAVIEEDIPTWMTQLMDYLKGGVLPGDKKEARKLRLKARQYELIEGVLYRRSFLTLWLRCVGPLQADDCQIHRPVTRHPQQHLTPITAPWPFYKWGIDIAGPFPEGPEKVKYLIVVMDYFTKWIEAKAVATITGGHVKNFVWDNIVCHFVIPTEIGMPTYRTAAMDVVNNDKELRLNLDPLEERRERVAICEAKAKSKMMKYYNARVRGVTFKPCDFVYRNNDASHAVAGGKLGPKWEGPYEVIEALGDGAYKLRSMDETILPRTWNIANLKRCYL
uniref:Reverse transcriptase domain-containing protein n=1 Tax=Tanacetum cinerariifolium TaxID=118510 RepID=A0A699HNG1_TANCI|nr:reverse transcriptase domain-containing protein [Tanacetum cinerariifolium]